MSHKTQKIAAIIQSLEGGLFDPHYLGYFHCFNKQLFFEAHEVLEELWLKQRQRPKDLFYKGLIQLAGAFVHVQKSRRQPALALLKLARENLSQFTGSYDGLKLEEVLKLIAGWTITLETCPTYFDTSPKIIWPQLTIRVC